jgi:hypothetical protein
MIEVGKTGDLLEFVQKQQHPSPAELSQEG